MIVEGLEPVFSNIAALSCSNLAFFNMSRTCLGFFFSTIDSSKVITWKNCLYLKFCV